ncbi:MAG: sel1 repeat family protein [gamma proteobacterium symbiont of Bathyaustriella thionipta]|nr:sel1 repeat family protein [gamma proteobacterium symbiont of Bathyaustriella thionipta]
MMYANWVKPWKVIIWLLITLFMSACSEEQPSSTSVLPRTLAEGSAAYFDGNYEDALLVWTPLAKHGDTVAQFNLGNLYFNGEGVAKNDEEAAHWFRLAAQAGHAQAQANLGALYEAGKGVKKDFKQAFEWYKKAADQGEMIAQYNLGRLYQTGKGVKRDSRQALIEYKKSAEQGVAYAQLNLGLMYMQGQTVPVNLDEAQKWLKLAAAQKIPDAEKALQTIEKLRPMDEANQPKNHDAGQQNAKGSAASPATDT